jgi:hypothetical protein
VWGLTGYICCLDIHQGIKAMRDGAVSVPNRLLYLLLLLLLLKRL